jgi:NTE family protein
MVEVALALGGGGIKGIAHIGVLRSLEKAGIHVGAIAGTSAGGLVGSVYAAGLSPDQIASSFAQIDQTSLFKRGQHDGPSIMGLQGLTQSLTNLIGDRTFADLKIPFACTAVDINTAQEVILSHGRVVDAVLATIALPGIFPAVNFQGSMLVDGGILDPVPVALARWLAPNLPIVAVCLHPVPEHWGEMPRVQFIPPAAAPIPTPILAQFARLRIGQAFNLFVQSMDITSRMLAELRLRIDQPDVVIRPDVDRYGILDQVNSWEVIAAGERAAERAIPGIRNSATWSRRLTRSFKKVQPPGKLFRLTGDTG